MQEKAMLGGAERSDVQSALSAKCIAYVKLVSEARAARERVAACTRTLPYDSANQHRDSSPHGALDGGGGADGFGVDGGGSVAAFFIQERMYSTISSLLDARAKDDLYARCGSLYHTCSDASLADITPFAARISSSVILGGCVGRSVKTEFCGPLRWLAFESQHHFTND
eukprot:IDg5530t1